MASQALWAQGPHCCRIPGETDCVVRGSEETRKSGGGVSWPDEEVISKTWSVSLPNLPEAANSLQTIEGLFPLLLGTQLYKRSQSTGSQEDSDLVLPNTHTHLMTQVLLRMAPEDPSRTTVFSAFSKSSIRTQQRFQSRTVSLQSLCFSTWYSTHAAQPPPARE